MKNNISFNDIFSKSIDFYKDFIRSLWGMAFQGGLFFLILKVVSVAYSELTSLLMGTFKVPARITISLDPMVIEELSQAFQLTEEMLSLNSLQLPLVFFIYWFLQITTFLLLPFACYYLLITWHSLSKQIAAFFQNELIVLKDIQQSVRKKIFPLIGALFLHSSLTLLGVLLLVIPGIIFFIRFFYVYSEILFEGQTLKQALKNSWSLTRARFFHLLSFLVIFVILFLILTTPFYLTMTFLDTPLFLRYMVYGGIISFFIPLFLIFNYFLFLELKEENNK